jgi:hypothetical protein
MTPTLGKGGRRPAQQKELAAWWRGGGAGRPGWSRALHDRRAERRSRAVYHGFTTSECGRSNPRFESTPRQAVKRPAYEGAMNSMKRVAVRSAILSRLMVAIHPATRGSSASR